MRKLFSFILFVISALPLAAQVSVEAKIDSIAMYIGEQVHVTLTVTAGEGANVILPSYKERQMITPGVEVLGAVDMEKESDGDGAATYRRIYTLTSFDGKLYYLPPFSVKVDGKEYKSSSLALKVVEVPVDTANLEKFFGPKVFKTYIPRNIRLAEAPSHGKPIMLYDFNSKGAEAYLAIAEEFLVRNKDTFKKITRNTKFKLRGEKQ